GGELFDRRNPGVSQRRFIGLSFAKGHGEGNRPAGGVLLHGVLRWRLPRSFRPDGGQAHHGTPARPCRKPERSARQGRAATAAALMLRSFDISTACGILSPSIG